MYNLILTKNNVALIGQRVFATATEAVQAGERSIEQGEADDYTIDEV